MKIEDYVDYTYSRPCRGCGKDLTFYVLNYGDDVDERCQSCKINHSEKPGDN